MIDIMAYALPSKSYLVKIISGLFPGLIPPLHILVLYKFWGRYARRVDKRYCSCSCWDTVFKGTYESGVASYKHVYFNATSNTVKIWLTTVGSILILYESLKYELKLLLSCQLRPLMGILFLSSLFSHYYTWWVYINYWNDDFYLQWNHQLFFTLTEAVSTALVLNMSNTKVKIVPKKILIVVSIALIHILAGGMDQFVTNVIWREGHTHQVLRDLALVVPDILHVVLPVVQLYKCQSGQFHGNLINKDITFMILFISCGFLICTFL
ncbi:hypothetical protein RUM44_005203 [Polyplax serrata]|uniref:Uncharacterized protein n=1 Tax=Polyplax serrata TaxID=468196 RepID=A0ABR1AEC8_POLSC